MLDRTEECVQMFGRLCHRDIFIRMGKFESI